MSCPDWLALLAKGQRGSGLLRGRFFLLFKVNLSEVFSYAKNHNPFAGLDELAWLTRVARQAKFCDKLFKYRMFFNVYRSGKTLFLKGLGRVVNL